MTAPVRADAQETPAVKLSPKERKRIREAERRAFAKQERERIAAARAEKSAGTRVDAPAPVPEPAASPAEVPSVPPSAPVGPERTDEDRARDAAHFLRGVVMPLVSVVLGFFGRHLDLAAYTDAQALEDGKAWVPLCRRYALLDSLVTWASAPARLLSRTRSLTRAGKPRAEPMPET